MDLLRSPICVALPGAADGATDAGGAPAVPGAFAAALAEATPAAAAAPIVADAVPSSSASPSDVDPVEAGPIGSATISHDDDPLGNARADGRHIAAVGSLAIADLETDDLAGKPLPQTATAAAGEMPADIGDVSALPMRADADTANAGDRASPAVARPVAMMQPAAGSRPVSAPTVDDRSPAVSELPPGADMPAVAVLPAVQIGDVSPIPASADPAATPQPAASVAYANPVEPALSTPRRIVATPAAGSRPVDVASAATMAIADRGQADSSSSGGQAPDTDTPASERPVRRRKADEPAITVSPANVLPIARVVEPAAIGATTTGTVASRTAAASSPFQAMARPVPTPVAAAPAPVPDQAAVDASPTLAPMLTTVDATSTDVSADARAVTQAIPIAVGQPHRGALPDIQTMSPAHATAPDDPAAATAPALSALIAAARQQGRGDAPPIVPDTTVATVTMLAARRGADAAPTVQVTAGSAIVPASAAIVSPATPVVPPPPTATGASTFDRQVLTTPVAPPPPTVTPRSGDAAVVGTSAVATATRVDPEPASRSKTRAPSRQRFAEASPAAAPASATPAPTAIDATSPPATLDAGTALVTGGADRQVELARHAAWADGIARDIAGASGGTGTTRFTVAPATLGAVAVEIGRSADGATVRLVANSAQARDALDAARPQLVAEARAQGLHVRDAQVDLAGSAGSDTGSRRDTPHQPIAPAPDQPRSTGVVETNSLTTGAYGGGVGGEAGRQAQQHARQQPSPPPTDRAAAPRPAPERSAARRAADGRYA